ncbi:ABC transporter permease subunit [Roseobacter sp. HKCCD9010]|uniref:ABC transporter permease subunit n=1 Tax=Rhodobacterales TaxID=204455 RepID=UPI00119B84CE|nr:ABC transporter permease subunit [Fontisubflavum oceani]MBF9051798.1 ABC transporter permease subunit [Rhodobacterales bacterium HKCCD4356]NNV13791.1 ABC transporter permease subunit [Roseobacter sp. HKCCD7357]NNV17816.1 ABC transporter permease subunit [Roseobacter sp. HKCCD8768]NNV27423.1 ABC transporter permease subunit [Roseobacter sp. HKCCD8192]NNV31543.1 ABC transporter permease subunit [Roseobacter sp. HKCCD9061]NNV35943.1 ABC transporter permease subunit [Roseobacter sp. HKCCD9073]
MKRTTFRNPWLPILLLSPQLAIIAVFFYWPAGYAIQSSFYLQDPFGFGSTFVGMDNYSRLTRSTNYLDSLSFTVIFTLLVTFLSLAIALVLAVKADKVIRGAQTYRTLLMWVYAIAPPVAGLMGVMLFDQSRGNLTQLFQSFGWDYRLGVNYWDTATAMITVSVWKQIPVNFIFFLSGLQAIPQSVREAAMIDNRSGMGRFWDITFPLLAPTAFFLLIINITYALFDTFGIIDTLVKGEPGNNPMTLVYRVFVDGFRGGDLGGSSAQSVVLMVLVLILTIVQFRFLERRIHYT